MIVAFQNCGESLDLSSLDAASSGSEAPPTQQALSIIGQSNSLTIAEGNSAQLFVTINLQSLPPNSIVIWTQNGRAVQSGPVLTHNISAIELSQQGTYQALIVTADGNTLTSANMVISVRPNFQNGAGFLYNGVWYTIYNSPFYTNVTRTTHATNFCHTFYGSNATLGSFTSGTSQALPPNYAVWANSCNTTLPTYRGQVGNFCLFNVPGVVADNLGYTNITCNVISQ